MPRIPQRELRNNVSAVLRRAEQGERFTVTVDGRPVAELGPLSSARRASPPDRLAAALASTPVDAGWPAELLELRAADEDVSADPWRE
jgi:prevent-host-death family protein